MGWMIETENVRCAATRDFPMNAAEFINLKYPNYPQGVTMSISAEKLLGRRSLSLAF